MKYESQLAALGRQYTYIHHHTAAAITMTSAKSTYVPNYDTYTCTHYTMHMKADIYTRTDFTIKNNHYPDHPRRKSACTYVCTYIIHTLHASSTYVHLHTDTCIDMHIEVHLCIPQACVDIRAFSNESINVHIQVLYYIRTYIRTYVCTHKHRYVCKYICTYVRVHTCMNYHKYVHTYMQQS